MKLNNVCKGMEACDQAAPAARPDDAVRPRPAAEVNGVTRNAPMVGRTCLTPYTYTYDHACKLTMVQKDAMESICVKVTFPLQGKWHTQKQKQSGYIAQAGHGMRGPAFL